MASLEDDGFTKPGQVEEHREHALTASLDRAGGPHGHSRGEQWCRGACRSNRRAVPDSALYAGEEYGDAVNHEAW